MKLVYPAIFYPFDEKDGEGFAVEVPDLPGCATGGNSMAEAIDMAIDAASGWVLGEMEDGLPIPKATPFNKVKPEEPNGIVSMIVLDMDSYAEKYGNKAVRKNLTIPAWLATAADKLNINYSQTLQNALIEQINM
ncbi:MAG: type II toxin-antitoxin system HicB family antitoxin [Oscillospiraceae bacterium]|nr:type II toxin-antitoxin system HicB family antitoxin [Oscillospiraceae bacterium]